MGLGMITQGDNVIYEKEEPRIEPLRGILTFWMQTERFKNRPICWKFLSDTREKPGDCGMTQAKWREFLKVGINNWKQHNASGNLIRIIFAKMMEI